MVFDRFKYVVAALLLSTGISTPVWGQETVLDDLFQDLAEADPSEAARLETQIINEWEKSGSPAMDLLLRRGKDALEGGQPEVAIEHFSALVDHAPNFAEGYYGRASSYYFLGLTGPALDDIAQTLRLNPRHFEAMRGLAIVMEDLDRPGDALEIYRMIMDIHPHSVQAIEASERLALQLEGQSL